MAVYLQDLQKENFRQFSIKKHIQIKSLGEAILLHIYI